nr:ATP-binding protein [uncultured Tyzzerella sp.]
MMIIIILGLLFNVFILFEDAKNPSSLALSSILVLCIIPSTIYTYIKLIEYNDERLRISIIEKQNKYYEQQLLTINNLNKASKSVKHDYKNHISIIKSLIDNEEFEKLKDYTYDICSKIDNIEKMYFTENIIINSILTFKVDNIKENNINYNFNIKIPKDLKISHVDITIIISNLLDNAIEACIRDLKTINKHINFSLQLKNNLLIIKCNNTFDGILKKTSKGIISRKMNDINIDCGIGLFNIENIVKKYDGIMELKYDKQIFNVEITLII